MAGVALCSGQKLSMALSAPHSLSRTGSTPRLPVLSGRWPYWALMTRHTRPRHGRSRWVRLCVWLLRSGLAFWLTATPTAGMRFTPAQQVALCSQQERSISGAEELHRSHPGQRSDWFLPGPRSRPFRSWRCCCVDLVDDDGDELGAGSGVPSVGSARGAVPGLLRVRFPEPAAEPGVRVSPRRALHVRLVRPAGTAGELSYGTPDRCARVAALDPHRGARRARRSITRVAAPASARAALSTSASAALRAVARRRSISTFG